MVKPYIVHGLGDVYMTTFCVSSRLLARALWMYGNNVCSELQFLWLSVLFPSGGVVNQWFWMLMMPLQSSLLSCCLQTVVDLSVECKPVLKYCNLHLISEIVSISKLFLNILHQQTLSFVRLLLCCGKVIAASACKNMVDKFVTTLFCTSYTRTY